MWCVCVRACVHACVRMQGMKNIDVMYRMVQCFAVMVQQIHFCDHDIFLNRLQLASMFEGSYSARTVFNHDTAADQACVFLRLLLTVSCLCSSHFYCLFVSGNVECSCFVRYVEMPFMC